MSVEARRSSLTWSGVQGRTIGGAWVSPMHANYFVNLAGGTAGDVRALIDLARREVADRFGVALETEVKRIDVSGRMIEATEEG